MTDTLGCALAFGLTMTAFAASTSFSATLPAHQGDTEVSTVRKATSTKSFSITINSIGSGTDKVCAWTEGDSTGTNYSSPYNQVGIETKSFSYTTQPYASAANKYGCSYGQVYAWVRKYKDKGIEGLYDRRGKNKAISQLSDIEKLKAENRLLKAQTQQQQMEIDFLKKLDEIERR